MYIDYKPSTAEWMDLLSIANTYGLKRVYRRAVAKIEDIDVTDDPVNRVLLAKGLTLPTSRYALVQILSKLLKPKNSGYTLL